MDELARGLAAARDEVLPAWSDARSDRLLDATRRLRRQRRTRRTRTIVASTATLVLGCGALAMQLLQPAARNAAARQLAGTTSQPMAAEVAAAAPVIAPTRAPLQLADGSRVERASATTVLEVERDEPRNVQLNLRAGAAHFEVVPNKQRQFLVRAAEVEVFVVGTAFDVERTDDRVRVAVSHGKVRVRSERGTVYLQAGESGWFGNNADDAAAFSEKAELPQPSAAGLAAFEAKAGKQRAGHAVRRAGSREDAPRWRSLSQGGDYETAYKMLAEGTIVEDDSEALLDAADAARLSGHPEDSLQYLRSVLTRHRSSPVAPLAAFTLGRVLLERLGEPIEAAGAFATARELAPDGSLAQDALAREVEAWSKGGHPQEAYERARQYVTSYPEGRRLRAVQLYGGLRGP